MSRPEQSADRAELEEFERAILSHASNLLGVGLRLARSRSEAEDLVQDTLVKALHAREQYGAGSNMKAWLIRILKNTFINRYRRSGLERNVLEGPDAGPLADGWIGSATLRAMRDPEGQALRPVLEREIARALDSVSEEFRVVVVLADVEGLTYKEIADIVGCPVGTVMSRLFRGRGLLKTKLVEQARLLGVIADEEIVHNSTGDREVPVELDAYRSKRNRG